MINNESQEPVDPKIKVLMHSYIVDVWLFVTS